MIYTAHIEQTLLDESASLGKHVGYSSKVIHAVMNQRFKEAELDLTIDLFIILKILHGNENVIQQDLARACQKDKSAILRMVNSLQARKWVARIPDSEDKRRNYLVLTQQGMAILKEATSLESEVTSQLTEGISQQEFKALKATLSAIRKNAYKIIKSDS